MDQLLKVLVNLMPAEKKMSSDVKAPVKVGNYMGKMAGNYAVRIAGLSGALAVIMGAYGAHAFKKKTGKEDLHLAFETGNRYHLVHSVALLAAPLTNRPHLVSGLLIVGMLLFSGSCYCYALTEMKVVRRVTPVGGMTLIAAWVCMAL